MIFPSDDKQRKAIPIFDGCVMYFPNALAAVAEISRQGNEQHNPGQPLHWSRAKSTDQFNTALRHLIDHKSGSRFGTDGKRHLAQAAWRVLAALQIDIEAELADAPEKAEVVPAPRIVAAPAPEVSPQPGPRTHYWRKFNLDTDRSDTL